MSRRHDVRIQAAGRPLVEEEIITSTLSLLAKKSAKLRQQSLFDYGLSNAGTKQEETGFPKGGAASVPSHSRHLIPWGDPYITGKEVHTSSLFRLISHNVNGLSASDEHSDVVHMASAMSAKSASIFGLQETNRNFEKRGMVESFHRVIRGTCTHYQGSVSSAKLQWPHDYQPGGTAVAIRNQWATRCLAKGSDAMGRWAWVSLAGRGTTTITVISAYRVCDGANEASITSRTVRAQQEWMYADRGHASINLREQFVSDITVLINDFQLKGHSVVLMMDANEGSGAGTAVDRMCYDCNLADVHTLHGKFDPPPTYQRGSKKIDFVLVSANIVHTVRSASILALHDGYLSDHRALLVDFDASALFLSNTSEVIPPVARRLTSTSPRAMHSYIHAMKLQLERHNIEAKVIKLQQDSERGEWTDGSVEEWERLDCLLAEARRSAERKCKVKRSGQHPWSPALRASGQTWLYWKMRMRTFTGFPANAEVLAAMATELKIPDGDQKHHPSLFIRTKIRQSKQQHKKVKAEAQRLRDEHLIERASFLSATHGMSKNAACAAIETRENRRNSFDSCAPYLTLEPRTGWIG